jgi:pantoate--beta-alanine ligase
VIIIKQAESIQNICTLLKQKGKSIAFIPTMGNLHAGHLSLFLLGKKQYDVVIGSIFINPMQFSKNEDFDGYPQTLDDDIQKLEKLAIDYLFVPNIDTIYPKGMNQHTQIMLPYLTQALCGIHRPHHFKGVLTVVNILLNIIQPNAIILGKKDYQQCLVISAMIRDLFLPIKVIMGDIVREASGLAMSSRNAYLTSIEKQKANQLRNVILKISQLIQRGERNYGELQKKAIHDLTKAHFSVDYFKICSASTLIFATQKDKHLLIASAARMGKPRLLDNIEIDLTITP